MADNAESIAEIDIWRTANLLVERHGQSARLHAQERTADLLAKGDEVGAGVWARVTAAVEELLKPAPADRKELM